MKRTIVVLAAVFAGILFSSTYAQAQLLPSIVDGVVQDRRDARRAKLDDKIERDRHDETIHSINAQTQIANRGYDTQDLSITTGASVTSRSNDSGERTTLYQACLDHHQPNCADIIRNSPAIGQVQNVSLTTKAPTPETALVLINQTQDLVCVEVPGLDQPQDDKDAADYPNCHGEILKPRQPKKIDYATWGKFQTVLSKDYLTVLGTSKGTCRGEQRILLQTPFSYINLATGQDTRVTAGAYINDIGYCDPKVAKTRHMTNR